MPERQVGVDFVVVAAADPRAGKVAGLHEVGDDPLGGPLGYADAPGDVPEPGAVCLENGTGNNPFAFTPITDKLVDCKCADFYRITIYKGVKPAVDLNGKVILDAKGDIPGFDKVNEIYTVHAYLSGGNFQIHPLTGFDLH